MPCEEVSQMPAMTANVSRAYMLFSFIQRFMRTLIKWTDFYTLIAESKNQKYFGGTQGWFFVWEDFRKTAGGAVSSQSKHLISSKKKKGKGREREREKRTSTIPLIWCIWKLCSFNFFTAILSSCTYQNESKRPANLIGFCEQARTSQQGLFYLACSFLRKKALQLSLRSGRASQLSRVCLCAGGTSPHFKGSML